MAAIQPENLIYLLGLPDHLRTTLLVAQMRGQVTAQDVAAETKRRRNVESDYLNQLAHMGLLEKTREGHTMVFMAHTKLKEEVSSLYQKLRDMPSQFRQLVCEDMMTAFENRVKVFSNLKRN